MNSKIFILSIVAIVLCEARTFQHSNPKIVSLQSDEQGCTIRITGDLGEPQPLILNPATDDFLYPSFDSIGVLQINTNQQIDLYCTTGFANPATTATRLSALCESGIDFWINNELTNFTEVTCYSYPYHTARKTGQTCANGEGVEIEIGFDIGTNFLRVMDNCHDEAVESSIYSHIDMSALNYGYQSGFERPSFLSTGFFGGKYVDNLYTNVNQVAMVTQILGSEELALKYVQPVATNKYMARGHLTAKVEVIYGSQQRSTFWFMNVAPQYQTFNAGNWESVESATRKLFRDRDIRNGEVYTGTHGILTFPDINNVQQQIFLYFDENNNGQIPSPELFYKILLDNDTKKGIAIIGMNNIYLSEEEVVDHIYCNDISAEIDWISWTRHDITLGYMYACTVEEWAAVVGNLPAFDVSGGLLI